MSTYLLEARSLVKHFPVKSGLFRSRPLRAVDGVDLALEPGETLAVVGESGCGKSTLARLLVGLLRPTSGDVIFGGRSVADARAGAARILRRDLQIVFQDPYGSLNPRMTVGTIVERPLVIHHMGDASARRENVAELFRAVGLPPAFMARYPHELSGGQRQRVAIARALATRPKLVVADEPTSGLDVSVQAKILNLLRSLQRSYGLTYVFISHDMRVVRHMADRVAVMYLGRIVELTTTTALFDAPGHPYTRALLAAVPQTDPRFAGRRITVQGDPPSPLTPPGACRFHPRCPFARDICRRVEPPLERRAPDHEIACHLVDEITSGRVAADLSV
ncbi:MAG TPA: dipeptide ABC transporter ATP-binding protein [Candidatus Limnocylindria bacterium]|nr:dipeptide ABC transporter ATP-binding protein [Candidatus Limnocylindria bacterium]